ncbi:methyltransferase domain-containing protein [Pyrodictium occultum]|uniref:methyltransferase domain-containing protein n=1 Tax=Pyrodictium occultum TaxID=2309 RepID=UPI001443299D|nr:methyltransferase domain-containing protein [Pyrodictium occultum]
MGKPGSREGRLATSLSNPIERIEERRLDNATWQLIINQIERIKQVYDYMNKIMSLGIEDRVRHDAVDLVARLLGGVEAHSQPVVVDVGSGPGSSVRVIRRMLPHSFVVAVDPSVQLLASACTGPLCDRVAAVAESLPVRSGGADFVTSFYASRDFRSLSSALYSMISAARRAVVIGDVFLPRQLVRRLLVRSWICWAVPVLAFVFARRYWGLYRGLCITIRGWCDVEELGHYVEHLSQSLNRAAVVHMRKYMLGGLGYVAAIFGEEGAGSYNGGQRDSIRGKACGNPQLDEDA